MIAGQSFGNTNDSSIVSRLDYGNVSFLFTGDAETLTEAYLVSSGADIDADILDVGHHGSKSSSSQQFLQIVTPQIAAVQVGANNRYGHPHQETISRLQAIGAKIYRTDLCGDIKIFSDTRGYWVESGCAENK